MLANINSSDLFAALVNSGAGQSLLKQAEEGTRPQQSEHTLNYLQEISKLLTKLIHDNSTDCFVEMYQTTEQYGHQLHDLELILHDLLIRREDLLTLQMQAKAEYTGEYGYLFVS